MLLELLSETFIAGDEVASTIAPIAASHPTDGQQREQAEEALEENNPLATSEKINKLKDALMGGFKKSKDPASTVVDPMAVLASIGGRKQ